MFEDAIELQKALIHPPLTTVPCANLWPECLSVHHFLQSWSEPLGTNTGLWSCSHVKSLAKGERTFTFCGSNVQWMAPEILKGTGVHQGC